MKAMPTVSNVVANQRGGTTGAGTIVDISYDVEDADSDSADISIAVSDDGGTTFDVLCVTFTGDVGRVAVGPGKSITWQAGVDVPEVYWPECQVKVTAQDVPAGPDPFPGTVVDLPGGATMAMIWIEPGTFTMGSPDSDDRAKSHEKPQHEVTITEGFYLGKYEVTQAQWASVMGGPAANPNMPKANISWNDVQEFIAVLNTVQDSAVYRMPTEAEWEYACRAGTTTRFSFGDDESYLGDYAWYGGNSGNVAHEVGGKLPNPWGLYDMHGNVFEWVQDRLDPTYYETSPPLDPPGPATGVSRVVRGGCFGYGWWAERSANREDYYPHLGGAHIGVRLLRQEL